jgi:ketosteroid isomerase-like protein
VTITNRDADTVRRFYAAFIPRDFDTMRACFTPDAVWHLPGRSAISGDHRGWDAIRRDFLDKTGPLSGGTLRAGLVDVAVGETHLVAVQHATASRDGRELDVSGCQLIRMEDGLIAEVTGHYSDQYAFDAFWRDPNAGSLA